MRRLPRQLKFRLLWLSYALFVMLDRAGIHLMPKHYYTPVPDIAWLRKNRDAWIQRASMTGVHWDLDEQALWLRETCTAHSLEVVGNQWIEALGAADPYRFGHVEPKLLHCVTRRLQPPRVVEIGSGLSTAVISHAGAMNVKEGGGATHVTAIEPADHLELGDLANVTHIQDTCQSVPIAIFGQLQAGDMLFVDSSHSVKVGSDVLRIYLEIIPSLVPGIYIHAHDITLPYLYPRRATTEYLGWQESSLLLALLVNNPRIEVLCATSALHYDRPEVIAECFPDYRPQTSDHGLATGDTVNLDFPSSIWMRTC